MLDKNTYLDNHERYMKYALDLAKKGRGKVSPNPLVGCVIVKDGRIIGEGFHEKFGHSHAEVNALKNCIESPIGSSLYVNLEPCSIDAKTPPCTRTIIENSISKVYIGVADLNPHINGQGIEELKKAGIEVNVGILYEESFKLNKCFFKWIKEKKPWVIAKVAQTKDGFMGLNSNKSVWITGEKSKIEVHKLRTKVDSIMVGKNTALVDNPNLTVREVVGVNPKRVIIDTNRSLPLTLKIFNDKLAKTYILCSNRKFKDNKTSFSKFLAVKEIDGMLCPDDILSVLGEAGITSVLIEGGNKLLNSFYKNNLIDEMYIFTSNKIIEGAELSNPLLLNENWNINKSIDLDDDSLIIALKKDLCLQES